MELKRAMREWIVAVSSTLFKQPGEIDVCIFIVAHHPILEAIESGDDCQHDQQDINQDLIVNPGFRPYRSIEPVV